jgi:hypothetical protein
MFGLRPKSTPTARPGDLIGFSGESFISDFINVVT